MTDWNSNPNLPWTIPDPMCFRRTVRKHLAKPTYQEMRPHLKRRSLFDPYAAYVLQRWQEGMHDGHHLYDEIAAQGFRGGLRTVQRYLHRLRPYREGAEIAALNLLEALSARKAVWLFVRDAARLAAEERLLLSQLRSVSPTLDHIYGLVQEFRTMVHTRTGNTLDDWMTRVKACHVPELQRFVNGIERDKAAVVAGLTRPESNAQTEGQNTRLKLLKRMMYGRAKLDLLKVRLVAT